MSDGDHARIKRHFAIVAHGPDEVELRYGTWNPVSFTLSDHGGSGALLRVLRNLDGRPAGAVAEEAGVSRREVEALVEQLSQLDVVEHGPSNALDHYLDHAVPNLLPYGGAMPETLGGAIVLGDEDEAERVAALLESGAPQVEIERADKELLRLLEQGHTWQHDGLALEETISAFDPWVGRLVVWTGGTVRPHVVRALNRVALRQGFSWLHASLDGPFLLIGPAFLPGRSPCYECLERRVLMNLREAASYQRYATALAEARSSNGRPHHNAVLGGMLASMTAFEALNLLLTGTAFTVGRMLAVYLPTFEFTFNEVLTVPGCPACSPSPERDDRELYFDIRALLDGR